MMTSVLVVVGKNKEQFFLDNYFRFLLDFNKTDVEQWKKRAMA